MGFLEILKFIFVGDGPIVRKNRAEWEDQYRRPVGMSDYEFRKTFREYKEDCSCPVYRHGIRYTYDEPFDPAKRWDRGR
jgi:hypothetical protein